MRSAAPPSSWIVCIGTTQRAKCARSPNVRASAQTVRGGVAQLAGVVLGAGVELGEQQRVEVERGDAMPVARELERDAPGSRADVEDRSGSLGADGLRGELAPERQVGVVAAALQFVPDDVPARP